MTPASPSNRGAAGRQHSSLHQLNQSMKDPKKLTRTTGAPVPDNQNVQTAGPRGPLLMQDVWFLEKMAHFDRELIPERRMHAKGSGAFGVFEVTHDISAYSK